MSNLEIDNCMNPEADTLMDDPIMYRSGEELPGNRKFVVQQVRWPIHGDADELYIRVIVEITDYLHVPIGAKMLDLDEYLMLEGLSYSFFDERFTSSTVIHPCDRRAEDQFVVFMRSYKPPIDPTSYNGYMFDPVLFRKHIHHALRAPVERFMIRLWTATCTDDVLRQNRVNLKSDLHIFKLRVSNAFEDASAQKQGL